MIATLLVLLATAVGVGAILIAAHADVGYVLISYGPWMVETTLLVLVLGIALCYLVIYILVKLLFDLLHLPAALRETRGRHREQRSRLTFEAGLLHMLEGHWKRAEVELLRHVADRQSPHLNYLTAARAAQRLGAGERRDRYLQLAVDSAPADGKRQSDSGRRAILITRAELQCERGEHAAVKATALELRTLDPTNSYAIKLLAESMEALCEWQPLHDLLQEEPTQKLDSALRRRLQQRALAALLQDAVAQGSLDRLKELWNQAAGEIRAEPAVRLAYARSLMRMGAEAEVLALGKQVLDQGWDADLARLCDSLHPSDPLAYLATVEQWLQRYGERPELLAAAGHACLENQMWGKAQSYLEAVLRVAPTVRAHLELARLAEQTRRPDVALQHYREGLKLATQTAAHP